MRRLGVGLLALLVLAAAATCVRLGFWQLSRMHQKRVLHDAQRAALALPAIDVEGHLPAAPPAPGRRARVRGRWDRSAYVLLSGRTYLGAAGVSLVGALRLPSGEGVLVERGWLAAADSRLAHPERFVESTAVVTGVVVPFARTPRAPPWVALPADSAGVALWSARALEGDSAAARFAPPLAPWALHALPDPRAPRDIGGEAAPISEDWVVPDEAMHLSYAIQWFAFAIIIAGGSLALALRKRPGARAA